jgi:predicted secreted hydrolase
VTGIDGTTKTPRITKDASCLRAFVVRFPHLAKVALVLLTGFLSLMVTACGTSAEAEPRIEVRPVADPAREAPRPVVLPEDDAPHDALSEWWYYTGHLQTESGKRYGFELVFFQAVRGRNPVGYAAHFAITDHQRRSFSYDERVGTSLRLQGDGEYRLELGGWRMGGEGDEHYLQADGEGYSIDLKLRSIKPPALHGGIGWISLDRMGDSYYYSRTRMEVEGTISDDGVTERVTGLSWMDHQWGDFILANGGAWDWFSLQLNDGSDLMITVRREQPGSVAATYGTLLDERGAATELADADLLVEATGEWRSPRTGILYPSGWRVRLPGHGFDLILEPVIPDQELETSASTGVTYWEGEIEVSGTWDGVPVAGLGYVELTGYEP